jgi:hypothetical protein
MRGLLQARVCLILNWGGTESSDTVVIMCASAGVATTTIRNFGRSGGLSIDLVKMGEGSIATSAGHDAVQRWGDYSAVQIIDNRMWFAVPTTRMVAEISEHHEDTEGKHHHKAGHHDKAGKKAHSSKAEHRHNKAGHHGHAETLGDAETHSSVKYSTWISVRGLE